MIALEFGNGRAIFGPANGLTQPWGTAHYNRNEPNKMLLNTIEWLIGVAQSKILGAEDELYKASKAATQTITDQINYMAGKVAADVAGEAYGYALGKMAGLIPKYFGDMIPTDPNYEELRQASDKYYGDFMSGILTAAGNPGGKIAADVIEGLIDDHLRTTDGLTFEQAIDAKHIQFTSDLCGQLRLKQPTDALISSITTDMNFLSWNIEKVSPQFIQDFTEKFDQVEKWKDVGTTTHFILIIGGCFLLVAAVPTDMATLPFAVATFQTAQAITYLEWGSDASEAAFLFMLYRDVYENEYKVLNRYDGELVKVMDAVEGKTVGGTLPVPKADLSGPYSPEKITLSSLATFGGTITNTGDYDEAARLVVYITAPSQISYGPFYSDTKAIKIGQSEDFSIDVPFAPFDGYFSPGSYEAQIKAEYGITLYSPQLGDQTPSVYQSFNVEPSPCGFYKSVALSPSSSTDVTVLLHVRNLSGSDDTITITDTIPKELAASVDYIKFETPPDEIVEADPVVKWSLNLPAGASAEIVYRVHTSLSPEKIEWLIPAATLKSSHSPDQSSLITIGGKEVITEDVDTLLLQLKGMINVLPGDSFNGGNNRLMLPRKYSRLE